MNVFTNLVNAFIAISHYNFNLIQFSELLNRIIKLILKEGSGTLYKLKYLYLSLKVESYCRVKFHSYAVMK